MGRLGLQAKSPSRFRNPQVGSSEQNGRGPPRPCFSFWTFRRTGRAQGAFLQRQVGRGAGGRPAWRLGEPPGLGGRASRRASLPPRAQWQRRPVSLLSRGGWGFSWSPVREGQGLCWKSRLSTGTPGVVHARGLVAFGELKALGCLNGKVEWTSPLLPEGLAVHSSSSPLSAAAPHLTE